MSLKPSFRQALPPVFLWPAILVFAILKPIDAVALWVFGVWWMAEPVTVSWWDIWKKRKPDSDEKKAVGYFVELYGCPWLPWRWRTFFRWVSAGSFLASAGILILLELFFLRPHWFAHLAQTMHVVDAVFWRGVFPAMVISVLLMSADYWRFRGKDFLVVKEQIFRRHFHDVSVLERLRDNPKTFSGTIPSVATIVYPHRYGKTGLLVGRLVGYVAFCAITVLGLSGQHHPGAAVMALICLIVIGMLPFVLLGAVRSFWDWSSYPRLPVAAALVDGERYLGLPPRILCRA